MSERSSETPHAEPPEGLLRRRITLSDGRYMLFYTSDDGQPAAGSEATSNPEAAASPAPVDSQPVVDDAPGEKP